MSTCILLLTASLLACMVPWYHLLVLLSLHSNFISQCVHFFPPLLLFNSVLGALTTPTCHLQHRAFSL